MTQKATNHVRRMDWKHKGESVYAIEVLEGAPTFNQGDGYDGGRNLLSMALIGPYWRPIGWVIGKRGDWRALPWNTSSSTWGKAPPLGRGTTVKLAAAALQ